MVDLPGTSLNPTSNGGMQNGSSVGLCAHCIRVFARSASILHAQSVLSNAISASELRRKFTKSPLLVGQAGESHLCWTELGVECLVGKLGQFEEKKLSEFDCIPT